MVGIGIGTLSKRRYIGFPFALRSFWQRVRDDGGTMFDYNDVIKVYRFLATEGLIDDTELLYLSNGGAVQRVDGVLKYIRTAFDATTDNRDLDGSATATQQPRLVGGIAPLSKVAASNQTGDSRKFTHTSITVTGTYTVVKMLNTTGKYANAYTEVVGGTITEATWTGGMRLYMVYAGTLTAGQRALIDAFMLTLYPEIESVDIGTQTWATRNFEAVATPVGNVINSVTENGAVEKITQPFTFAGWNIYSGSLIDANTINGAAINYFSLIPSNKWVKVRIVGSGEGFFSDPAPTYLNSINLTGVFDVTAYRKFSTPYPIFKVNSGNLTITTLSIQELNWSNATEIYDAVYAATVGDAVTKEYAALKEAAMWCYYNNSADNGAIYGKLYNWYAAKLLDLDMVTAGFGWRVPTSDQFTTLQTYLGGASVAGDKMKMTGLDYWNTPNTGATNESGFTALGGGFRIETGLFTSLKDRFLIWGNNGSLGDCQNITNSFLIYANLVVDKRVGTSIRLIKE